MNIRDHVFLVSRTTHWEVGQIKHEIIPSSRWYSSIDTIFSTRTASCTPHTGGSDSFFLKQGSLIFPPGLRKPFGYRGAMFSLLRLPGELFRGEAALRAAGNRTS
jgi:hypothetical protein